MRIADLLRRWEGKYAGEWGGTAGMSMKVLAVWQTGAQGRLQGGVVGQKEGGVATPCTAH